MKELNLKDLAQDPNQQQSIIDQYHIAEGHTDYGVFETFDDMLEPFGLEVETLWTGQSDYFFRVVPRKDSASKLTQKECEEVYRDFLKCSNLALRLDSMFPDSPGAFTGTVSERLQRSFDLLSKQTSQE